MNLLRGYHGLSAKLACDVISFCADNDSLTPRSWQKLTAARACMVVVPGDHVTFCQSYRYVIIEHLRRMLAMI